MEATPINKPDDRARIVVPDLRPPADPPGWRRVYTGIACLLLGFTAIFFGGSEGSQLALAISGSILVIASLSLLRAFRLSGPRDYRKLYSPPRGSGL